MSDVLLLLFQNSSWKKPDWKQSDLGLHGNGH